MGTSLETAHQDISRRPRALTKRKLLSAQELAELIEKLNQQDTEQPTNES